MQGWPREFDEIVGEYFVSPRVVFGCPSVALIDAGDLYRGSWATSTSLCVYFLQPAQAPHFDFALVFSSLREIVGELHP
jgi:hypothetical protein